MSARVGLFERHAKLRRTVATTLAALSLSACVTWQPAFGRADYVTAARPSHVRAVLWNDERVDLYSPTAVGSQIVGYRQAGVDSSRVSIPTRVIKRIEVRKLDQQRTTALVVAVGVVGAIAGLVAMAMSSMHFGFTLPIGRL